MGCCDGTAALTGSGWVAVLCPKAGSGKSTNAAAIATGANIGRDTKSRRSLRIDLT
jgi:hypothetical protein